MDTMLRRNLNAFYTNPKATPQAATNVTHKIELKDQTPIKQIGYKTSEAKHAVIKETVDKLLEKQLIEPSYSAFSSPVVLVKKQGGAGWRMCIDYRKLNAQTIKDAYPIPIIEDCLQACKEADFFSLIDIKDAYHHIAMDKESMHYTAFVTPEGLFQWKVMPFGLTNAPATFQRYINTIMKEYIGVILAAFFDDGLTYTKGTFEQHVLDVEKILKRLAECHLEANIEKCKFGYTEMKFVGHVVSKGIVRPDPSKIRAMESYPQPTNLTQLRSFLGLVNYYHKFIKGFAVMAVPLYRLTRKDTPFEWNSGAEIAFKALKQALTSAPCLYSPDFKLPFKVHTDACIDGIGGVLLQNVNGEDHPCGYVSRQLSTAERNYATTEWECLAIVWTVGQFEPYLIDSHFTIVTDHSALKYLMEKKLENRRLMRWAMKLSEFTFTIEHRPGKDHADADTLSRNPLPNSAPIDLPDGEAREDEIGPLDSSPRYVRRLNHYPLPYPVYSFAVNRRRTKKQSTSTESAESSVTSESPQTPSSQPFVAIDTADLSLFSKLQKEDPAIYSIIDYLKNNRIPTILDDVSLKRFKNKAHSYTLVPSSTTPDQELLYYSPSSPTRKALQIPLIPRLVVPAALVQTLINIEHASPFGGHVGIKRTFQRLCQLYYWPTMLDNVTSFINQCRVCQMEKANRRPPTYPPNSFIPPTSPFEVWSMDYVGPLSLSEGFKYILVLVCHFSSWAVAIPTINTSATTTASILIDEIICKYGVPRLIISDRGSSFNNSTQKCICDILKITQLFTPSYRPQANGKVERLNGTIKSILQSYSADLKLTTQWVQLLQAAVFAYNTSVSQATGFTPYFLLFGREAITPGNRLAIKAMDEYLMTQNEKELPLEQAVDQYAQGVLYGLYGIHSFVHSFLDYHRIKQREITQATPNKPSFKIGDLVWVSDARRLTLSGKFKYYNGPYKISKIIGDSRYEVKLIPVSNQIRISGAERILVVHVSRLKPFREKDTVNLQTQEEPEEAIQATQLPFQTIPQKKIDEAISFSKQEIIRKKLKAEQDALIKPPKLSKKAKKILKKKASESTVPIPLPPPILPNLPDSTIVPMEIDNEVPNSVITPPVTPELILPTNEETSPTELILPSNEEVSSIAERTHHYRSHQPRPLYNETLAAQYPLHYSQERHSLPRWQSKR